MSLISAPGKQRQVDLCEFEASLVYKESPKAGAKAIYRETLSPKMKTNKQTVKQRGKVGVSGAHL